MTEKSCHFEEVACNIGSENCELHDLLKAKNETISSLTCNLELSTNKKDALDSLKLKEQCDFLTQKIKTLENSNDNLTKKLGSSTTASEQAHTELVSCNTDLQSYMVKYKNECQAFEKLKAAFDQTMTQIETQNKQAASEREKSSTIQTSYSQLNINLMQLQEEHNFLIKDFDNIKTEHETLKKENENAKKNLRNEKANAKNLENSMSIIKSELGSTEKENEQLKADLEMIMNEKKDLGDKVLDFELRHSQLNDDHGKLAADLTSRKELLSTKKAEKKRLEEELESQKTAKATETTNLKAANVEIKSLKDKLLTTKSELAKLQSDLTNESSLLKKSKTSYEAEHKALGDQKSLNNGLNKGIESAQTRISNMRTELES
jgi:chromosome segregation ATPase